MFDIFLGGLADIYTAIIAVLVVMGLWFVTWTWAKTRSLVPTLGSIIVGVLIIWGAANFNFLTRQVNDDVGRYDGQGNPGPPVAVPSPPVSSNGRGG